MQELIITATLNPGKIEGNFDEVEAHVKERLAEFDGAQFTEQSRKLCKSLRADLRKEKTEITDRVKQAKKEWMAPFEEFEAKAKKITGLFDEKIEYLDAQDKEMEAVRVSRKKEAIKNIYLECFETTLRLDYPLESIYNPRWENATFTENEIREEIISTGKQLHDDIQNILAFNSTATDNALEIYKKTRKLSEAIAYIRDIECQIAKRKEADEARKREEELQRIREEERAKLQAEQKAEEERLQAEQRAQEEMNQAVQEAIQETIDSFIPETTGEEELQVIYNLTLTPSAKEALETYMNSVGIEWEVLA